MHLLRYFINTAARSNDGADFPARVHLTEVGPLYTERLRYMFTKQTRDVSEQYALAWRTWLGCRRTLREMHLRPEWGNDLRGRPQL